VTNRVAEHSKGCVPRKATRTSRSMSFTGQNRLLAPLMIGLVIVVLVGCASRAVTTPEPLSPTPGTPTVTAGPSASSTATPTLMDVVAAETRHFMGDRDAPVTIIEFGDFQ